MQPAGSAADSADSAPFDVFALDDSALRGLADDEAWGGVGALDGAPALAGVDAWRLPPAGPPPLGGAAAAAAAPAAPAAPLNVLRCLDLAHPRPCPFCSPAPLPHELDAFALVGDAGGQGGLKRLRALVVATPEWRSGGARAALASLLERRPPACGGGGGGAGAAEAAARLAAALRSKRSGGLTKGCLVLAARAWGYQCSLWSRRAVGPPPPQPPRGAPPPAARPPDEAAASAGPPPPPPPPRGRLSAAHMRLLGGGYRWDGAVAASPASAASRHPQPRASAFAAAARREADASLRPLAGLAAAMLAGGAAEARLRAAAGGAPAATDADADADADAAADAAAGCYFGAGDVAQVRVAASYFEGAADEWATLVADCAAAAADAASADAASAVAAAAAAAGPRSPPPPAAARWAGCPAAWRVAAALRGLQSVGRRYGAHNCPYAFSRHPAVQQALRRGDIGAYDDVVCGEAEVAGAGGDAAAAAAAGGSPSDVAPPHAASVAAFMLELFRGFCAHVELCTRCELLLAEAGLGPDQPGAAAGVAAVVAALLGDHAHAAGCALRGRAAWMAAALRAEAAAGRPAAAPRERLLFQA